MLTVKVLKTCLALSSVSMEHDITWLVAANRFTLVYNNFAVKLSPPCVTFVVIVPPEIKLEEKKNVTTSTSSLLDWRRSQVDLLFLRCALPTLGKNSVV